MTRFKLDATTLLAGLLAGILPAFLLVVISYLYLTGLTPEVVSSLQEPHLERVKERCDLLHEIVDRRRFLLVAELQRALLGDAGAELDQAAPASADLANITKIRWYLHHLDDASYERFGRSPRGVPAGSDRGEFLLGRAGQADRAGIERTAAELAQEPAGARDPVGMNYLYAAGLMDASLAAGFAREVVLSPSDFPPEILRDYLQQRDYQITLPELPCPIEVRSEPSPHVPSTIEFDTQDDDHIWLSFRNGVAGGTLAVRVAAEPYLDRALVVLEERFPTPEGVVFQVNRSGSSGDPDRLWGRWPLHAPFGDQYELWAGLSEDSTPLLVTVLRRLGTIHYLYGGLSLLALMTIASFLLTGLLSRRVRDSRQKDDFLRLVSHELRTPIASIRMIAETLKLNRIRNDDERQEFHGQLENESRRLGDLIERVLEYGKGAGEREVVTDPGELVAAAVARFRERERTDREVDIRSAQEFHPVLLDREAVIGVVYNLLSNASKYSAADAPIEVTIGEESRQLFIAVRDHGPGIRPRDLRKVFRPFYRGENSSHARGFGLGLAYCREVARHHGGRISVSSELGDGSRFTLEIPLLRTLNSRGNEKSIEDEELDDGENTRR